jgi:1-acyl-sn-glycerol-3-phosphate acyltransferase
VSSRRLPSIPPQAPRFGHAWSRALGRAALALSRWRVEGEVPDVPRLVAVVAPHTCWTDLLVGLAVVLALGVRVSWLGKHTIFRPPLSRLLRCLGGIPVDRQAPESVVAQAVEMFRRSGRLYLALAPEGTRRRVERWKTGFHRIALGAGVPIVPVWLDYGSRCVGIGPPLAPSGDVAADLARLAVFFDARMARHPERFSPPQGQPPTARVFHSLPAR